MTKQELDTIRAKYAERQRLITREAEIRALPVEAITPELDAEALECWMELERVTWSDDAIGNMLAHIDALEAQLAAWEDDTPPASQPKAEYPVSVQISSVERGEPSGLLQSETDELAHIDALANLRELREREAGVLFVNCHTGECLDDVWVVLDYVATLEAVADAAGEVCSDAQTDIEMVTQSLVDTALCDALRDALRDALKGVGK